MINKLHSSRWTAIVLVILALSSGLMGNDHNPESQIVDYVSETDLKSKVFPDRWYKFQLRGNAYIIASLPLVSAGNSREMIACWVKYVGHSELRSVWKVALQGVGSSKLDYDPLTGVISVIGAANNEMNGKVVATVNLNVL